MFFIVTRDGWATGWDKTWATNFTGTWKCQKENDEKRGCTNQTCSDWIGFVEIVNNSFTEMGEGRPDEKGVYGDGAVDVL